MKGQRWILVIDQHEITHNERYDAICVIKVHEKEHFFPLEKK